MQPPHDPFDAFWRRHYPGVPPLSFVMRGAMENWVRFHSLPESKRYPEGDAEMAEVLGRANTLASAVLEDGAAVWLVQAIGTNQGEPPEPERWLSPQVREFPWVMSAPDPEDEEDTDWHFYAGLAIWTPGAFDELLAEVALDRAAQTLWASTTTGAVFAPYDGGTDLYLPTAGEVENLRRDYGQWLSAHPLGL